MPPPENKKAKKKGAGSPQGDGMTFSPAQAAPMQPASMWPQEPGMTLDVDPQVALFRPMQAAWHPPWQFYEGPYRARPVPFGYVEPPKEPKAMTDEEIQAALEELRLRQFMYDPELPTWEELHPPEAEGKKRETF
jgi:hypothetical protein